MSANRKVKTSFSREPLWEAILLALLIFVSTLAGIMFVRYGAEQKLLYSVREDLARLARGAASVVDGDLHKKIVSPSQKGSEEHLRALEPLIRFHESLPEVAYVHTFVAKDSGLVYVLDTATAAKRLRFRRPVPASDIMQPYHSNSPREDRREWEAVRKGLNYVSENPSKSDHGSFMTGLAPIRDSKNLVVGAVGVDLDVDQYIKEIDVLQKESQVAMCVAALVSLATGLVFWRIRGQEIRAQKGQAAARVRSSEVEERNSLLIQALGQIAFHYNAQKDICDWSGDCRKILGYFVNEMCRTKEAWLSAIHPEDRQAVMRKFDEIIDYNHVYEFEYRFRHRDGSYVWILDRGVMRLDVEGKSISIDGFLLDISERKSAEQELAKLALATARTDNAVIITDRQGRVEWVNESFTRITGYTFQEIEGNIFISLLEGPETSSEATHAMKDALENGRPVSIEIINYTKSGKKYWVSIDCQPIHDATGKVTGFVAIHRDVTNIKNSEEKYRSLVNNLQEVVFRIDSEGRWTFLNPAWERLTGYTVEECLGRSFLEFVESSEREYNQQAIRSLAEGKEHRVRLITRYLTKTAQTRWAEVVGMSRNDKDGIFEGIEGTLNDITERKTYERKLIEAREEAEAANRTKSEFLAVMSHEIRTPMNAVVGYIELLLHSTLNDQQREYLETILTSGNSLVRLINDILDFSKMESGGIELHPSPMALRQCVEEVVDLYAHAALSKGVELIADVEDILPANILCDQMRFRQVLINLVGNSVKFTKSGEIVLTLGQEQEDEKLFLKVIVKDSGIGIPRERQAILFKPFSQVDSSTTRLYGGTGLGLAICEKLVAVLGGSISVESAPGEGSSFCFRIPLALPAGDDLPDHLPDFKNIPNTRIALWEGNSKIQSILKKWLTDSGLSVEILPVEGAVDLGHAAIPLAIIDENILRHRFSSFEMFEKHSIPVLLLTYKNDAKVEKSPSGKFDSLPKPIHKKELLQRIACILLPESVDKNEKPEKVVSGKVFDDLSGKYPLNILIAEDNPINRMLLIRMLQRFGYHVEAVEDGVACLEAVEKQPYDLIFLDIQMPQMDGYETARRLREMKYPATLVALTAHALADDREKCLDAGMNDYITKPLNAHTLREVIRKWAEFRRNESK